MKLSSLRCILLLGLLALLLLEADAIRSETPNSAMATDAGWPRKIVADGTTITIYQPQAEKWDGNRLQVRAAVAVQSKAAAHPTFGVIWATARTETDKEHRLVTLDNVQIT